MNMEYFEFKAMLLKHGEYTRTQIQGKYARCLAGDIPADVKAALNNHVSNHPELKKRTTAGNRALVINAVSDARQAITAEQITHKLGLILSVQAITMHMIALVQSGAVKRHKKQPNGAYFYEMAEVEA